MNFENENKDNSSETFDELKDKSLKPSWDEAINAVKTLIKWAGDNPDREGLLDTPDRVLRSYKEFFAGYNVNPEKILSTTFEET